MLQTLGQEETVSGDSPGEVPPPCCPLETTALGEKQTSCPSARQPSSLGKSVPAGEASSVLGLPSSPLPPTALEPLPPHGLSGPITAKVEGRMKDEASPGFSPRGREGGVGGAY